MLLLEAVGSMCQIDSLRIERGSGVWAWAASGTGSLTVNWEHLLALAFAVILVLSEN